MKQDIIQQNNTKSASMYKTADTTPIYQDDIDNGDDNAKNNF
jgi:hypothetical protein